MATRREGAGRGLGTAVAAMVLLGAGGCSIGPADSDRADVTGSIGASASALSFPLSADLDGEDWRRAKGALAIALDPQGNGGAVKWENPDSGTGGTFTPVAQPFVKSNDICRAFIATVTFPGRTSSLQGTGCRISAGEWEISDVRPWRRSGV